MPVIMNGGRIMNKAKSERVLNELDRLYPNAWCELHFQNELELLIAVMLSAQTTDKHVNKVTPALFAKYKKKIASIPRIALLLCLSLRNAQKSAFPTLHLSR